MWFSKYDKKLNMTYNVFKWSCTKLLSCQGVTPVSHTLRCWVFRLIAWALLTWCVHWQTGDSYLTDTHIKKKRNWLCNSDRRRDDGAAHQYLILIYIFRADEARLTDKRCKTRSKELYISAAQIFQLLWCNFCDWWPSVQSLEGCVLDGNVWDPPFTRH